MAKRPSVNPKGGDHRPLAERSLIFAPALGKTDRKVAVRDAKVVPPYRLPSIPESPLSWLRARPTDGATVRCRRRAEIG